VTFVHRQIYPCLSGHSGLKSFLNKNTSLKVIVTNRFARNWNVYYSGTIENERGEKIEFKDIDNGLCVNAG